MYTELPADVRDSHPYHMYEEIKAQPEAVRATLASVEEGGAAAGRMLAQARRVLLVGCGTSLHAAQYGAWALRHFSRGKIGAFSMPAFEFATYFPGLRPDDAVIVVSHSGTSAMSVRSLERARRAGAESLLVTGFGDSPAGQVAGKVLLTGFQQERSWAHTASYTSALVALAALANALADPEERLDLSPLPQVVEEVLHLEEFAHRLAASTILAERDGGPGQIVLVGAGPNAATAREGALKLIETSYADASSWELEQMLHGPLTGLSQRTLLWLVAPSGQATERATGLCRALGQIGVEPVALVDSESSGSFEGAHRLLLPDVPEILSPISTVIPLQLFSYYLSVGNGLNPDLIRRDDDRYRSAAAQYD